jgi:hypothetical protein
MRTLFTFALFAVAAYLTYLEMPLFQAFFRPI